VSHTAASNHAAASEIIDRRDISPPDHKGSESPQPATPSYFHERKDRGQSVAIE
jgi:hypothetical protein